MRLFSLPSLCASLVLAGALFPMAGSAAAGENWPDFRGPQADGIIADAKLPVRWSAEENVAWQTPISGEGWSSPVIWDGQIWLTTARADGKQLFAICVDQATGKLLHDVLIVEVAELDEKHTLNSFASPSPVIEPGRVYVHFGTYGTACLDTRSAEILWKRTDVNIAHQVGPGSSPVLYEDLLLFHCDGTDQQFVVALDKGTGKTVWKTDRSRDLSKLRDETRKAFSTPIIAKIAGEDQLISPGAHAVYGYEPSSGRELWRLHYDGFSNVSRPIMADGLMILNTGFTKPQLWGVRLGDAGMLSDDHVAWRVDRSVPTMPSVVLRGGLIYMVDDRGVASCVDAKSGENVWTERIGGAFSSSLAANDGRIFFFDRDGKTTVINEGRKFDLVAENTLPGGFMASPAVSGNAWFLRTKTHLFRIEE